MPASDRKILNQKLVRQWKQIYSPFSALSFCCGAFYDALRAKDEDNYRQKFIDFDNYVTLDCPAETAVLKDNNYHGERLMQKFMGYCAKPLVFLVSMRY